MNSESPCGITGRKGLLWSFLGDIKNPDFPDEINDIDGFIPYKKLKKLRKLEKENFLLSFFVNHIIKDMVEIQLLNISMRNINIKKYLELPFIEF